MIAPQENGIVFYKLRSPTEVRKISEVPQLDGKTADKDQLKLARNLVESMTTTLKKLDLTDKYHDALREMIEAKNNADNLIYQTEKALRDLGDKVPSAERGAIETKINDLKSAAQTDDINRIKQATDEVQNAFHALSQQLYAQGQPQPQGGPSAPPPSNAGDVIDGEVRE